LQDDVKEPHETPTPAENPAPEPAVHVAPAARSDGSVRVEIEESDEEEEEVAPKAHAHSLAAMSKKEFAMLTKRLQDKPTERTLFCSRRDGDSVAYANKNEALRDKEGRKVILKIEEVPDASGLDNLLKDAERCSILWKKHQGYVVPLRSDVENISDPDEAAEAAEAWNFLQVTVPRILDVLHVLASNSELHCELSSTAVKHIWPLISSKTWRQKVLELLMEWSQVTVSARALAEFASRYPKPHLQLLVDAVTREEKDNIMPPNFEETARKATERLDKGQSGIEEALDDMLRGLSSLSAAELAVSTLGNVCVAGHVLPNFKEQIAPFCDVIVEALSRHLKPLDWRLCGRAAGTIANICRCGSVFLDGVQEKCLVPLVTALREEAKDQGPSSMVQSLGAGLGKSKLPFVKATARLLGALQNFIVLRPSGLKRVHELGVLEIVLPLMETTGQAATIGSSEFADEEPSIIASRALTLASRLVREAPDEMALKTEIDILCRMDRILEHECRAVGAPERQNGFDTLDLALRILTALITKREGVLDRLTSKAPRFQELPEGVELSDLKPVIPFGKLVSRLMKLMKTLKAEGHLTPEHEGSATSRIRGNLALLFAKLVEAQADSDAPPDMKEPNFEALVEIFVDWLRKERGAVQQNIGVCLTRLAQTPRYKQRVRDLNGIESLHQIMLPKVQADKEEAMRQHRLKGRVQGGMD